MEPGTPSVQPPPSSPHQHPPQPSQPAQQHKQAKQKQQQQGTKQQQNSSADITTSNKSFNQQNQSSSNSKTASKQDVVNSVANQVYRLALFDHLPRKQTFKDPDSIEEDRVLHPATIQLGLLFQRGVIQHDDDRAQALLTTMMRVVSDYRNPPMTQFREELDRYIVKQVQYLVESRQLSKGMGNIIRYIRLCIAKIPADLSEDQAKFAVCAKLQDYLDDRIIFAGENIAKNLIQSFTDNEVILSFGSSPLIRRILSLAAKSKTFRLIVVDTRPLNDGLETLAGVSSFLNCTYCPLSAAAFALKDATKVLLGASSLLSNGCMLAPVGSAMVASLAKSKQIPVIVCAESYKFSDKVQLDSIVFNELGHASEIVRQYTAEEQQALAQLDSAYIVSFGPQLDCGYRGSADKPSTETTQQENTSDTTDLLALSSQRNKLQKIKLPFEVVNLRYDLTPLANISAIATETGLIPPTSVPILIRENQSENVRE